MKLHFSFSENDDNQVEVYRTLDNEACFYEVTEAFEHFLSMVYGFPITVVAFVDFNVDDDEDKEDDNQMELDLQ